MALAAAAAALVVALGAAGCCDDAQPSAPDGSPVDAVLRAPGPTSFRRHAELSESECKLAVAGGLRLGES